MKKLILIIAIIVLVITAGVIGIVKHITTNFDSLLSMEVSDIDMNQIEDGTYLGRYSALPISVEVRVTVKDHTITDINLLKHINGQGTPAEEITEKVLELQSLQVDTVTGATYSSKAILGAIKDALLHEPS